jgi:hypothetical protein
MLTTGSLEKPNSKGCATQFKSLAHPPFWFVFAAVEIVRFLKSLL